MKLERAPTFKEINATIATAPKSPAFDQAPATELLAKVNETLAILETATAQLTEAKTKLSQYHSQRFFLFRGIIRFCDNHFGIGNKLKKAILATQKIANKLLADKEKLTEITTRLAANEATLLKLTEQHKLAINGATEAVNQQHKTTESLEQEKNPTLFGFKSPLKPNAQKIAKIEADLQSKKTEASTKTTEAKELYTKIVELQGLIAEDKVPMTI